MGLISSLKLLLPKITNSRFVNNGVRSARPYKVRCKSTNTVIYFVDSETLDPVCHSSDLPYIVMK